MTYVPYTRQAVIGYDNVFTRGTLSASSEQEDGEKENAVDGFTFDHWLPDEGLSPAESALSVALAAGEPVDYLAIAAHNLGTLEGSIALEGSNDGTSWVTVAGPYYPESDAPALWSFAAATYSYWRVVVTGDGIALGVLQAGSAMVLPEGIYVGHAPAALNRRPKIMNAESEGGQLLGRSLIRQGAGAVIQQERVDPDWVRSTWDPFAEHAETRPFFFAWRHDQRPLEVIYGWSEDGATAEQSTTRYMRVGVQIKGQVE